MAETHRPTVLSGIQPTGELMLGNYLGAVKPLVEMQASCRSYFMLADLHSITVPNEPDELRRRTLEFTAQLLACGIDAELSTVFLQSQVPAHAQLLWVLNCVALMGELRRMTQFKDKAGRSPTGERVGLFDYPVLMAADILLYDVDRVTVGDDQEQHMEFVRRIARRFNGLYGEVFNIPESCVSRTGARLMGLRTPAVKMSKSDPNRDNYIALLDAPEVVCHKIRTAVTDSDNEIRFDAAKPGISNLMTIYAAISGDRMEALELRYSGKGYSGFKDDLSDRIVDFLRPIRARYSETAHNPAWLIEILRRGARHARERSEATLARVHHTVGFLDGDRASLARVGGWSTNPSHGPGVSDPTAAPSAWSLGRSVAQRNESADAATTANPGADAKAEMDGAEEGWLKFRCVNPDIGCRSK
jgi:tryptophanyl-tRNA synthetase